MQLYYFDSLLFATTENEFQVFPVACQPATLFDTIRQNRLTSYYVASTTTAKTDDQHKNESQEQSVINRLLDRQQTPTTAEFEQCFFDWVNLGDKQSADANALLSDYCDGIEFTDGKTATPSISTDLARAVIKRCLTDAQQSANQNTSAQQLMIWPEKVVEFLLRQGAISQRYIDSNTGVLSFLYTRGFHVRLS
jgi:hypothetical protein